MRSNQRGATLIIVLMLLVGILIIGTIAIRQSIVSLRIATNSQAQQLMMQNNDAAFFNVEREENLIQSLTSSGMFGYISGPTNKDKELVFCFRGGESVFFDIARASLMYWPEGTSTTPINNEMGLDGFCSASDTSKNFFTSGRRVVMTQVAVKFSSAAQDDPFYGVQLGTDDQSVKFERSKTVKVFSISLMPTLSSVSKAQIDTCLNSRMSEVTVPEGTTAASTSVFRQSVTECLQGLNVPFTSHVTEYVLAQDFV